MAHQIKITISPLGQPKIEAQGYSGGACAAATKPLEDALAGNGPVERVLKDEFHNVAETQEEQHQSW